MMMVEVKKLRPKFKSAGVVGVGTWDWSGDNQTVTFTSDLVGFMEHRIPEDFGGRRLTIFHPTGTNCLIGVEDGGEIAWRFNPQSGRIEVIAPLFYRVMRDRGLTFARAVAIETAMALVYEGGILLFNEDGSLRWRQDHLKLDWEFQTLTDVGVVYQDAQGTRWIYGIKDGSRGEFL